MPSPTSAFTGLDPRAKQLLKDQLYQWLYHPVQHKFDKRIKQIVIANSRYLASSQTGFMFRNEWYTFERDRPAPRTKVRLAEHLKPEMQEHLTEAHQLNTYEIPYVMGFVTKVLNSSHAISDYLRVFPTPLHPTIQELTETFPQAEPMLSDEQVAQLQGNHRIPIDLIKRRLVMNLLLQ